MTSRLASVTFKMASKVFIEETDKNFKFITEIPFRCLGFGDFKIFIAIGIWTLVLYWKETSSGVMNFKRFVSMVEQILRESIPTGHTSCSVERGS